jgi:SulP family sulfate permease
VSTSFFFRPRLIDALRGYDSARLWRDVGAGLTVGVVALPLAMAFAIASGLKPEAGLFTAIIAGLLISLLGGSRVQIGGPAGAFIVIVYGILDRYGLANLIIATALSGVMLFVMGVMRLGTLIRFIPVAVVIGFTNGIAVLIMVSQIKDFFGLSVASMPADFFGIVRTLSAQWSTFNPQALLLAAGSLALIVVWQHGVPALARQWRALSPLSLIPGSIVGLVVASVACQLLGLQVETIGSRFGSIPSSLPALVWPDVSWATAQHLLMPASTLAMLGAIESLLCARIADQMIGDRHDANQELMAQGIANFVTPFFGGMPATGTIARTVTNVKNGASSPVAGVVHALTLLAVILVAAPLANSIPLAALSAILMFVAWNMGEWHAFVDLKQFRLPYRATLLSVFVLTVVVDLTVAVEVGLIAACLTFIYRISNLTRSEEVSPSNADAQDLPGVQAHRLYGALFFGAVKLVEALEDRLPERVLVIDLKNLIYVDSSGTDALLSLARTCRQRQVTLILCGLTHQPRDIAARSGLLDLVAPAHCVEDVAAGLAVARRVSQNAGPAA